MKHSLLLLSFGFLLTACNGNILLNNQNTGIQSSVHSSVQGIFTTSGMSDEKGIESKIAVFAPYSELDAHVGDLKKDGTVTLHIDPADIKRFATPFLDQFIEETITQNPATKLFDHEKCKWDITNTSNVPSVIFRHFYYDNDPDKANSLIMKDPNNDNKSFGLVYVLEGGSLKGTVTCKAPQKSSHLTKTQLLDLNLAKGWNLISYVTENDTTTIHSADFKSKYIWAKYIKPQKIVNTKSIRH